MQIKKARICVRLASCQPQTKHQTHKQSANTEERRKLSTNKHQLEFAPSLFALLIFAALDSRFGAFKIEKQSILGPKSALQNANKRQTKSNFARLFCEHAHSDAHQSDSCSSTAKQAAIELSRAENKQAPSKPKCDLLIMQICAREPNASFVFAAQLESQICILSCFEFACAFVAQLPSFASNSRKKQPTTKRRLRFAVV